MAGSASPRTWPRPWPGSSRTSPSTSRAPRSSWTAAWASIRASSTTAEPGPARRASPPLSLRRQSRERLVAAAPGEPRQQGLADASAPIGRPDEQVLEIEAVPAAEARKIVEPEREADRLAGPQRKIAEEARMRAEERGLDHGLGRVDFVRKTLVLGEFANERQHEPGFTGSGRPDLQIGPCMVGV